MASEVFCDWPHLLFHPPVHLLPFVCLICPGLWALLLMIFWLLISPFWWHSTLPVHRSPFFKWNWHWITIWKTKWKWSFISKILFYKFKFKAFPHYKVNQWEQWCFFDEHKLNQVCLIAAVFCQPQHPNHFPLVFHCSVSNNPVSQREKIANSWFLHVILEQWSIKVKKGWIGKCCFKAESLTICNNRRA